MQNFRAKPDTKRATAPEPDLDDLLWTIAAARLILPDDVHVQAPPNLSPGVYQKLIRRRDQRLGRRVAGDARSREPRGAVAGDRSLAQRTAETGKVLVPRLPVYPSYALEPDRWCAARIATRVRRADRRRGLGARRRLGARSTVLPSVTRSRCWTASIRL